MDFLRDECDAWFGKERPAIRMAPLVAQRLAGAPGSLAPHDAWLRQVLGADIRTGTDG